MTRFVFAGSAPPPGPWPPGPPGRTGASPACTLHAVLRDLGLDPAAQRYLNLFPGDPARGEPDPEHLRLLRRWVARTRPHPVVVGMGRLVQRELTRAGIPHLALTHPAARGAIRARARYRAHVAEVPRPALPPLPLASPRAERASAGRSGGGDAHVPGMLSGLCLRWSRRRTGPRRGAGPAAKGEPPVPTVCCPNCGHAFALPPEIRRPGPRTPAWEWPAWVQVRFWSSVRKTDTHWFWEGPTNGSGYGVLSYQSRRYPPTSSPGSWPTAPSPQARYSTTSVGYGFAAIRASTTWSR